MGVPIRHRVPINGFGLLLARLKVLTSVTCANRIVDNYQRSSWRSGG